VKALNVFKKHRQPFEYFPSGQAGVDATAPTATSFQPAISIANLFTTTTSGSPNPLIHTFARL